MILNLANYEDNGGWKFLSEVRETNLNLPRELKFTSHRSNECKYLQKLIRRGISQQREKKTKDKRGRFHYKTQWRLKRNISTLNTILNWIVEWSLPSFQFYLEGPSILGYWDIGDLFADSKYYREITEENKAKIAKDHKTRQELVQQQSLLVYYHAKLQVNSFQRMFEREGIKPGHITPEVVAKTRKKVQVLKQKIGVDAL